jgi:hypothetical protein
VHFSRKLLWLVLAGCVPHVAVDGAPCPCPSGYTCCATLAACVPAGEPDACPPRQDESSGNECSRDADCTTNEICQAWKNADGKLAGPRQCRKACSAAACAADETCQLVPHDGALLVASDLVRACVPDGDSACHCSDCDDTQLGRTYCAGDQLEGCFLAFNEACGVSCETVVLATCPGCLTKPGGAACPSAADDGDACFSQPCSACDSVGAATCDGDAIVSCARASYPGEVCNEICVVHTSQCPAGSRCTEERGSECAP